jgi:hypothetical protein
VDREVLLNGLNVGVLASLFTFGAAPRPNVLGVKDYSGFKTLGTYPMKGLLVIHIQLRVVSDQLNYKNSTTVIVTGEIRVVGRGNRSNYLLFLSRLVPLHQQLRQHS